MNQDILKSRGGGNHSLYDTIISKENIFSGWNEFKKGKMKSRDVLEFAADLETNLLNLHESLVSQKYRHGAYESFYVCDPKRRHIHKAQVIDRVLHHVIYRVLYPFFDKKFIFDSYSSREDKGTHAAIARFEKFAWNLSKNNTKTVWILKCDIRKFFENIDHQILLEILSSAVTRHSAGEEIAWLFREIIGSFNSKKLGVGLPLGNLTSQLFVNIYMNKFDQFVKRTLKCRYYVRYADDFIFLSRNPADFNKILIDVRDFLLRELFLTLHDGKIEIKKWHEGVDFLGYVSFPYHRILRTKTKRRLIRKINSKNAASYLGILKHCNSFNLRSKILAYFYANAKDRDCFPS